MICKHIKISTRPGRRDRFIEQQKVWNDWMARQAGFHASYVATDPDEPNTIYIMIFIDSHADLDRFMAGDHDTVEEITAMRDLYEKSEISILDVVEPAPPEIRFDLPLGRTGSGYQVSHLSEIYRASCALRAAVLSGLFDAVEEGTTIANLSERLGAERAAIGRLVDGLAALNLLRRDGDVITLTPLVQTHLLRESPEYLGDLVLHNTRPALWKRWGDLSESLGLAAADVSRPDAELFLSAMSNIADAGQSKALLAALDMTGCRTLLDIGGGRGDYAFVLAEAFPDLRAVVQDLPGTADSFNIRRADSKAAADRVHFAAGDYRTGLPDGPFDAVLLSNVLRGETLENAEALLLRIFAALNLGGQVLIQDLFPDDHPGRGPLLASLFGLHLPDAMNGSVADVARMLENAGFQLDAVLPLEGSVVANKLIRATKART